MSKSDIIFTKNSDFLPGKRDKKHFKKSRHCLDQSQCVQGEQGKGNFEFIMRLRIEILTMRPGPSMNPPVVNRERRAMWVVLSDSKVEAAT